MSDVAFSYTSLATDSCVPVLSEIKVLGVLRIFHNLCHWPFIIYSWLLLWIFHNRILFLIYRWSFQTRVWLGIWKRLSWNACWRSGLWRTCPGSWWSNRYWRHSLCCHETLRYFIYLWCMFSANVPWPCWSILCHIAWNHATLSTTIAYSLAVSMRQTISSSLAQTLGKL